MKCALINEVRWFFVFLLGGGGGQEGKGGGGGGGRQVAVYMCVQILILLSQESHTVIRKQAYAALSPY